jgi:hypothetical protein
MFNRTRFVRVPSDHLAFAARTKEELLRNARVLTRCEWLPRKLGHCKPHLIIFDKVILSSSDWVDDHYLAICKCASEKTCIRVESSRHHFPIEFNFSSQSKVAKLLRHLFRCSFVPLGQFFLIHDCVCEQISELS